MDKGPFSDGLAKLSSRSEAIGIPDRTQGDTVMSTRPPLSYLLPDQGKEHTFVMLGSIVTSGFSR
jgi:hypothetical protein